MTDTQRMLILMELASELALRKLAEDEAKALRIETEERIAELIPGPEKGAKTVTLKDGRKITVERGFNYKADCNAIESLFASEGETRFAPVKTKTTRELDPTGYHWYETNDPDTFKLLAQHVTVTPKKTSVALKVK